VTETARAGALADHVRSTIEVLDLGPEDVALAQLAIRYAETIDRAAAIAAQANRLAKADETVAEEVRKLAARVQAHVAMADIGPKLLAALESLGASPKARAGLGKATRKATGGTLRALRGGTG
jgi:hypothetical protein